MRSCSWGIELAVTVTVCAGELCIQLELGTQGDLSRLIKEHAATGMPEAMIWFVLHQAITGLLTLKKQSIMHRDVKPQNLFVFSQQGQVRASARSPSAAASRCSLTGEANAV